MQVPRHWRRNAQNRLEGVRYPDGFVSLQNKFRLIDGKFEQSGDRVDIRSVEVKRAERIKSEPAFRGKEG